jgi:hypothetical protein
VKSDPAHTNGLSAGRCIKLVSTDDPLCRQYARDQILPAARFSPDRKHSALDPGEKEPRNELTARTRPDVRGFRKVTGYRAMPLLVAALRARDAKTEREPTVDDGEKAA